MQLSHVRDLVCVVDRIEDGMELFVDVSVIEISVAVFASYGQPRTLSSKSRHV